MQPKEIRAWMKQIGLPVRVLAAHLKCTPQHLGAVLSGRSRMTENMRERIEKKIVELCYDYPMTISFTIKAGVWRVVREAIPFEVDIQETLQEFIRWLASYFHLEKLPMQEFLEWEKGEMDDMGKDYTREIPLFVYLKTKKGEKRKVITIANSVPGNARQSRFFLNSVESLQAKAATPRPDDTSAD